MLDLTSIANRMLRVELTNASSMHDIIRVWAKAASQGLSRPVSCHLWQCANEMTTARGRRRTRNDQRHRDGAAGMLHLGAVDALCWPTDGKQITLVLVALFDVHASFWQLTAVWAVQAFQPSHGREPSVLCS